MKAKAKAKGHTGAKRVRGQGPRTPAKPALSDDDLIQEGERRIALSRKSATDQQLALVWTAWNALPAEMPPHVRRRILTNCNPNGHPDRRRHFDELRRRFPHLPLPFDADEYHGALQAAERWTKRITSYRTIVEHYQGAVEAQWAFNQADDQADDRIAIFRAVRELDVTDPGLVSRAEPTLAGIERLQSRYTAYTKARSEALNALSNLLYKVPGVRKGHPLPLEEQAVGLPWPPEDVPHYLYIARLRALGVCSKSRFSHFNAETFPRLNTEQRREFRSFSRRPAYGKDPYAALRVWLLDNRPILEHPRFQWHWNDAHTEAVERGIECPKSQGELRISLKQWAHRQKLRINMKRGTAPADSSGITSSAHLLSPAPVFGDVLLSARL